MAELDSCPIFTISHAGERLSEDEARRMADLALVIAGPGIVLLDLRHTQEADAGALDRLASLRDELLATGRLLRVAGPVATLEPTALSA